MTSSKHPCGLGLAVATALVVTSGGPVLAQKDAPAVAEKCQANFDTQYPGRQGSAEREAIFRSCSRTAVVVKP